MVSTSRCGRDDAGSIPAVGIFFFFFFEKIPNYFSLERITPVSLTLKPYGYWNNEKGGRMRSLFEQFARDNRFDPLTAENWYLYSAVSFAAYPVCLFVYPFLFIN